MFRRHQKMTAMMAEDLPKASVLDGVHIDAKVDDLFVTVSVEQGYRNAGERNIEAVYTFPLPLDGVLLSFEAEIDGRRLSGRVIESRQAEERYEEAITDGDSAILLEEVEPGLFTVSLGNLMPGEKAILRYRYGQLLRWNGDRVRLSFPTTVAPRYGSTSHLEPHQTPEHAFDAENRFTLSARFRGVLRSAGLISPSHEVRVEDRMDECRVSLKGGDVMDRDVVLEATLNDGPANGAIIGRDVDGWLALASFRPSIPADIPVDAGLIQIVVDCSGSMNGDSIAQARLAVERILDRLPEGTFFNVILFGSRQRLLFDGATRMNEASRPHAREFARNIQADMGGTEIGAAMRLAYRENANGNSRRDILLITDGAVSDPEHLAKDARASRHRIFTVGVGSAVGESTVRRLADATGGACELVSPREDMAHRIERHFQRMWTPACQAHISWPKRPDRQWPETVDTVYDGDTVHAFAWFQEKPEGQVSLELRGEDGRTLIEMADMTGIQSAAAPASEALGLTLSPIARMAAARRIADGARDAQNLALTYQLISEWTKCIVVHERAEGEKADQLPETIKVPNTLAAGWHGLGSAHASSVPSARNAMARFSLDSVDQLPDLGSAREMRPEENRTARGARISEGRSRSGFHESALRNEAAHDSNAFLRRLLLWDGRAIPLIGDLGAWGLQDEIVEPLRDLVDTGYSEQAVVEMFIIEFVKRKNVAPVKRAARLRAWIEKRRQSIFDEALSLRIREILDASAV